ncbi:BMP family ABC transporter substrate-binding protein [Streptomyces cocklensis]|uniref:Basic membrane protein A n=1 Tax=Actinacidiphila cocklensis TaxID=887465 RepID=A0A9W4DT33_9ACTN|nr:BMP family ABC transporter substrate-binding protein [Actinacidiphila cocklensis]MDD1063124.1 BMP family ABC transporter substrate-binding protein [Actinacidiphila cocklensis]CAG6395563.1 Basic membrane protein A [Actinacidiphila cocklensis]
MRRVSKIAAAGVVSAALALTATACGSSTTSDSGKPSSGGSSTASSGGGSKAKGVGMAYDVGGRGDHSFNDSAARGLDKADGELNLESKELTASNGETESDREQRLDSMAAAGYNPVVAVGYTYGPAVEKMAKKYPNVTFGLVDSVVDAPNVDSMVFATEQSSYLAGVAAALKSKSGKVGFIGGVQNTLIGTFDAGFAQGVKDTKPSVQLTREYLYKTDPRGFNDATSAAAKAQGMLDKGVDVIYTAAGLSGDGSIQKVAGKSGAWAIGVDSDQYNDPALAKYKNSILTSAIKNVDVAVYDLINSVKKDNKPKVGTNTYDLANGGVSVSATGGFIADIQAQIDAAKQKIVSGAIKVSSTP